MAAFTLPHLVTYYIPCSCRWPKKDLQVTDLGFMSGQSCAPERSRAGFVPQFLLPKCNLPCSHLSTWDSALSGIKQTQTQHGLSVVVLTIGGLMKKTNAFSPLHTLPLAPQGRWSKNDLGQRDSVKPQDRKKNTVDLFQVCCQSFFSVLVFCKHEFNWE